MSNERVIETPEQFTDLKKECIARVKFYIDKVNNKGRLPIRRPKNIAVRTSEGLMKQVGIGKILEFD